MGRAVYTVCCVIMTIWTVLCLLGALAPLVEPQLWDRVHGVAATNPGLAGLAVVFAWMLYFAIWAAVVTPLSLIAILTRPEWPVVSAYAPPAAARAEPRVAARRATAGE